jgi:predicted RNase H-like nuclease (RuvC/YqgF family)
MYAQLNQYNKAIEELYKEATKTFDFKLLEEFCQKYNDKVDMQLFEIFYKLLSEEVKKYQDAIEKSKNKLKQLKKDSEGNISDNKSIEELEKEIKINEELKSPLEKEMLEILKTYGSMDNIDPVLALDLANDHLNICKNKEFFNYLKNVVKNFTIDGNKYKIAKNLSDIGVAYKAKEEYDLKQKYVIMDSDSTCSLCKKKLVQLYL